MFANYLFKLTLFLFRYHFDIVTAFLKITISDKRNLN